MNGNTSGTMKTRPSHLRLDNLVNNTSIVGQNHHSLSNSYGNATDYNTMTAAPQQRLDSLLEHNNAPPPPERGSSFAVMSQALRSPATPSNHNITKNDTLQPNNTITPKKVSFQETTSEIIGSNSTPVEKILEDPNVRCF